MKIEAGQFLKTASVSFATVFLAIGALAQATVAQAPLPASQAKSEASPAVKKAPSTDADSLESIAQRMSAAKRSRMDVEAQIVDRTRRIQGMFDGYNKAERNLTGFNGLGQVEQMELKAELYGGERMARKKLAEEFAALNSLVEQWGAIKGKLEEDQRLYTLKLQIQDLKKKDDSKSQASSKSGASLSDIEYYEVKKDADLRTISSYPEVYGTPEFWDYLYRANKDKIGDPDKPVPAGTTLVVPQNVKRLPDFNEL